MRNLFFIAALSFGILPACRPVEGKKLHLEPDTDTLYSAPPKQVFMRRDGKLFGTPAFPDVYRKTTLDTIPFPFIGGKTVTALRRQLLAMDQTSALRNRRIGELSVSGDQLRKAIEILLQWQHSYPSGIFNQLEAWQIRGEDKRGNVLFTGYYTPVVPVKDKPDATFSHPIYQRPRNWEGPYPTRREIETDKVLAGLGLELAYAKDPLDIYFMQLQGSGFVEYANGRKKYLAYDGTNRHPFRGIESLIRNHPEGTDAILSTQGMRSFFQENLHLRDSLLHRNPSYTFFSASDKAPEGAAGVPLTGLASIAVDPRYIPYGACLLAAFPEYDPSSKTVAHRYILVLAQDTGGAIRGPGHVDFYTGIGVAAGKRAGRIRHYGRLWLLLPKEIVRPPFTATSK